MTETAIAYTEEAQRDHYDRIKAHTHSAQCFEQYFVEIKDSKGTPVMKDGKPMLMDVGVHHLAQCLIAIGMITPIDPHATTPAIALCGDLSCEKCNTWARFIGVER